MVLVGIVFASGPGDLGSIPGRVIPKTFKMVLDTSLLNTQQYKVRIKGKVEQSRERRSNLTLHLEVVAIEKAPYWSPSTKVANLGLKIQLNTTFFTKAWNFYVFRFLCFNSFLFPRIYDFCDSVKVANVGDAICFIVYFVEFCNF